MNQKNTKTQYKSFGHMVLSSIFEKHIPVFDIGDIVYLKTDPDQEQRIITGILVRQNGITYAVSHLHNEHWHYDFEMSEERDVMKATSS